MTKPNPFNIQHSRIDTPLGQMLLAAQDRALIGAWFEGQKDYPDSTTWERDDAHAVLSQAKSQIQAYFQGERLAFDVPFEFAWGTPFQREVWTVLTRLAYGATCSYRDIATQIGRPAAVRAVGGAIGSNPISIVVPCHRVVGQNGSLTGYTGGLHRKQALLVLESGQSSHRF